MPVFPIKHLRLTLFAASFAMLTACGGGATAAQTDPTAPAATKSPDESYINYLDAHSANYSKTGTSENPSAEYDDPNMTLRWTVSGTTVEEAENLKKHIEFMVNALENGQHPRPWDKLFLMDAYLKQQHTYSTAVTVEGLDVMIDKVAKDACTYQMLKTHAAGVSGKFFEGDIKVSFTLLAEQIIASPVCDVYRSGLEAYINQNLKKLPNGITLVQ